MNKKRILNKTIHFIKQKKLPKKEEQKQIETITSLLKVEDRKVFYDKLYDALCEYLDTEFQKQNFCQFKNRICARRNPQMNATCKQEFPNGCCYSVQKKENCIHLQEDGKCNIKNLSCKLFTCGYLKRKKIRFSLNKIYLSKYTLTTRQKLYLTYTFFQEKEEVLKKLPKR